MRQWMCNPLMLCQKHLLGEHVEHHMFVGTFKKKLKIDGYIKNNLVEPLSIPSRHYVLAWELVRRSLIKYNGKKYTSHQSWINENEYDNIIQYLPYEQQIHKINKENAINDLLNRCVDCQIRYFKLIKNQLDIFNSYFLPSHYNIYDDL